MFAFGNRNLLRATVSGSQQIAITNRKHLENPNPKANLKFCLKILEDKTRIHPEFEEGFDLICIENRMAKSHVQEAKNNVDLQS
eukprot:Pgem_evm1s10618